MPRPKLRLRFMTFPIDHPPRTLFLTLPLVDCSVLTYPPPDVRDGFTGLSYEVRLDFFRHNKNINRFHAALSDLKDTIRDWNFADGNHLIIPVACILGVHRSVVMAEGLAKKISDWEAAPFELKVQVEHLSLWPCVERQKDECHEKHRRYLSLRDKVNKAHTTIFLANDGTIRRAYVQGAAVSMN